MSKKINIVIKNGTLTMGGGEKVLINILQNIDKNKYNIILIIDDDNGENNVFLKDIPCQVKVYFLRPQSLVNTVRNYSNKREKNIIDKVFYNYYLWKNLHIAKEKCIQILKSIKNIDIFIDFNGNARKYINRIESKKKIIWRHLSMSEFSGKRNKIRRYGKYASKYDFVITICNRMKKEVLELLPKLEKKIKVLYNPINFEEINNASEKKCDFSEKDKRLFQDEYILTVSRLDNGKKDYDTLIKGYKKAMNMGLPYKLYIIGDGPGKEYIESSIVANNLENNIILLGSRKNPYVWMKKSEFFVLSSKEEGFGLVLVEAMGLKKAVISSDCPVGPREILKDGECGVLFEVGDYQKLADCFIKFYTDRCLRKYYENVGFERVQEFNLRNTILKFEELIDSIVKEKNENKTN